jgi:hypothetical protein
MVKVIEIEDDRNALPRIFKQKGYKVGAEIGVDQGKYSEVLCRENPEAKLYAIDPWKVYRKYADITDVNDMEKRFRHARARLRGYNCQIIRESSEGAIRHFKLDSLDFVYIDGNHAYEYVLWDLRHWLKIVRVGGIVSGHDYTMRKHKYVGVDVKRAIDKFLEEEGIEEFYLFTKPVKSTWYFERKK